MQLADTVIIFLFADIYDVIACSGAFIPGHLRSETVREMLKIVKPGKRSWLKNRFSYNIDQYNYLPQKFG